MAYFRANILAHMGGWRQRLCLEHRRLDVIVDITFLRLFFYERENRGMGMSTRS